MFKTDNQADLVLKGSFSPDPARNWGGGGLWGRAVVPIATLAQATLALLFESVAGGFEPPLNKHQSQPPRKLSVCTKGWRDGGCHAKKPTLPFAHFCCFPCWFQLESITTGNMFF